MAAVIQGIGAFTALTSANSFDTSKSFSPNSRRSLSVGPERKGRVFVIRSDGRLGYGLNGRGGRAEQLITNGVVRQAAASTSSKPGHELLLFEALREDLEEEMDRDPTVCVMGEDVGHYGGSYKVTKGLAPTHGDLRVLDTPIAENSFTGMGIGASMTGLRPVIEGMNMGFLLLAFNHISNNCGCSTTHLVAQFKIPSLSEVLMELVDNLEQSTLNALSHISSQFLGSRWLPVQPPTMPRAFDEGSYQK